MATPPPPVTDLAWGPEGARDLGTQVVELWAELIERLPELPVNRPSAAAVWRRPWRCPCRRSRWTAKRCSTICAR